MYEGTTFKHLTLFFFFFFFFFNFGNFPLFKACFHCWLIYQPVDSREIWPSKVELQRSFSKAQTPSDFLGQLLIYQDGSAPIHPHLLSLVISWGATDNRTQIFFFFFFFFSLGGSIRAYSYISIEGLLL